MFIYHFLSKNENWINVTHLIKMSPLSANYIVGKTAKYDQTSFFTHFQILMELGIELCF